MQLAAIDGTKLVPTTIANRLDTSPTPATSQNRLILLLLLILPTFMWLCRYLKALTWTCRWCIAKLCACQP